MTASATLRQSSGAWSRSGFFRAALAVLPGLFLLLAGCEDDYWYGNGDGASAAVTTPSGVQTGDVAIVYTLTGDMSVTDVKVEYSTDGRSFREASEGAGSDGVKDLSVSTTGEVHTFVWASGEDLSAERSTAVVRITPEDGEGDETGTMDIHNRRYLVGVQESTSTGSTGRVRLYQVDAVNGSVQHLETLETGGQDPYDVLYRKGRFFVANETSGDVSVMDLDAAGTLVPVDDSPFHAGIAKPRYLATDGERLYLSGAGDSVGVLDMNPETGSLIFNSSVYVPGCRGLVTRSGYLYVASETAGQIVVFDIQVDGELLLNGFSPITGGGLVSPRSLVFSGTRLYVANATVGDLCGFNLLGGGNLAPITGSPFSISAPAGEQIAANGGKLFGVSGVGGELLSLSVDLLGAVTEDGISPVTLPGSSFSVASAGQVVIASAMSADRLAIWLIDELGVVSEAPSSPVDSLVGIVRVAISD